MWRMLDKTIQVLDKGFVRLVDVMGDDMSIVRAARVSYGQESKGEKQDRGLINYLVRHQHTSPLEQVHFTFHERLPVFVARQKIRTRTANVNEISGRYVEMKEEYYTPDASRMLQQSTDNKQGSGGELIKLPEAVVDMMEGEQRAAHDTYKTYLDMGLAKEVARINLPLSLYTEWYWTIDLHNLLRFLYLRLDKHAQWEIQQYAQAAYDLVKDIVPWTIEAWEEHQLYGKRLSRTEWAFVRQFLPVDVDREGFEHAVLEHFGKGSAAREFMEKLG